MRVANEILIPEFRQYIAERKEVLFTPSGVSMRPFIEGDRDSVVLTALEGEPRIGDILLVSVPVNGGTYVLHRLVRIENDEQGKAVYVLQGDGNLFGEERCNREDIIARIKANFIGLHKQTVLTVKDTKLVAELNRIMHGKACIVLCNNRRDLAGNPFIHAVLEKP